MSKPTTLKANCPRCKTMKQAFTFMSGYVYGENGLVFDVMTFQRNDCCKPVLLTVHRAGSNSQAWNMNLSLTPEFAERGCVAFGMIPAEPKPGEAPEFTPENIAKIFDQACRSLS